MLKLSFRKASIAAILLGLLEPTSVQGQIVPDSSVNSRVTPQGNTFLIENGSVRGTNLFHSFQKFSVPTGGTAHFNNNADIKNIFSRVTGKSVSNIDGIVKANSTANLFIVNPNGIVFGKNAQLNIGGSFMGTTANSIQFPDGIAFSAISPQSSPLLTVKQPIGLVFGSNPGAITVKDSGHQLFSEIFSPISRAGTPPGLQVLPGKTLALLGGDVSLNGGIIFAPGGQIELGSVEQGQVAVDTKTPRWSFDYQAQSTLGKIELTNRSFLDTSGEGGASLGIYGRQIFLKEDSVVVMQNLGVIPDKELRLEATELIDIRSADLPETLPTGLYSVTANLGSGAQTTLFSPAVVVSDGGILATRTFSSTKGGNISIEAPSYLNITGTSPIEPVGISLITTLTFGSGTAGNINISTSDLTLSEGGRLSSATFSEGEGGMVSVKADLVRVTGFEPQTQQLSSIRSGSLGPGEAGSLVIDTSRLILAKGGTLNTSTSSSGNSGKLTINASELIEVIGSPGKSLSSSITAEAVPINPRIGKIFNLPPIPSGDSGSVTINTSRLKLTDEGRISALNQGTGDAGELKIFANNITLEDDSLISAETFGGEGGNVSIFADLLSLKDSSITASATKKGRGGSITIISDLLVALGESSLTAEAEKGQGGDIFIKADAALFGPDVDISVSSDAGLQLKGTVTIDVDETGAEETIAPAPDLEVSPQVISACNPSTGPSKFVAMGPGALRIDSRQFATSHSILNTPISQTATKSHAPPTTTENTIEEATGWTKKNGKTILIVDPGVQSTKIASNPSICNGS